MTKGHVLGRVDATSSNDARRGTPITAEVLIRVMVSTSQPILSVPHSAPRLPLVALLAAGITSVAPPLHADEPAAPIPAPAAETARAAPGEHEKKMVQLRDELNELELQRRVEQARSKLERERREHDMPNPPERGAPSLRKGSIVLPEVLGFSSSPIVYGVGVLNGIGASGLFALGFTTSEVGYRTTMIGVAPSLDVFVSDHVTIGGRLQALRVTSTQPWTTETGEGTFTLSGYSLGLAPRVGYVAALSPHVLLWPQAGLSLGVSRSEGGPFPDGLTRSAGAEAEVALAFPLGRHVLARVGPSLSYLHVWSDDSRGSNFDSVNAGMRAHLGLAF